MAILASASWSLVCVTFFQNVSLFLNVNYLINSAFCHKKIFRLNFLITENFTGFFATVSPWKFNQSDRGLKKRKSLALIGLKIYIFVYLTHFKIGSHHLSSFNSNKFSNVEKLNFSNKFNRSSPQNKNSNRSPLRAAERKLGPGVSFFSWPQSHPDRLKNI